MLPLLAEVAAYSAGVFTRGQALACGYSAREIRRLCEDQLWIVLRHGVYVDSLLWDTVTEPERSVLQVAAARFSFNGPSIGSHESAVLAYGLPLLTSTPTVNLTSLSGGLRGSPNSPIVIREGRLDESHCLSLQHVPFTAHARTLVDVCSSLPTVDSVVTVDAALRRGLTSYDELVGLAEELGTSTVVGRVLALADARSESVLESVSRVALWAQGIDAAVLQHEIRDRMGKFVGRADFWWPQFRVVGEADGLAKYTSLEVVRAEKLRQARLEELDITVVRWTWEQIVEDPARVAARVRKAFARAA